MSVSPQPHAQHPPPSRSPPDLSINNASVPSLSHATNTNPDSPAQLASLLSDALHQVDTLKRELNTQTRRADALERIVNSYSKVSAAPGSPNPDNPVVASAGSGQFDEAAARHLILEYEARVDRAELDRSDLEARIQRIQAQWAEDERILFDAESKITEVRTAFSQIIAHRGGHLVVINGGGPHATTQLANLRATESGRSSRHSLAVRTTGSRVRPRAGSMDGSYGGLTGPGGPPPAKRARNDRHTERDLQVPQGRNASQSPGSSPRLAYPQNGQADGSPLNGAALPYPQHPSHRSRAPGEREDGVQIRYTDATGQISHRAHRGRHEHRTGSRSRSRSRSRASSASLDEMLLEATTGDDGNPIAQQQRLAAQGSQHLLPHAHASRGRHRSPSNEEYLIAQNHSRSRVPQGPGVPGNLPGNQVQTYQTHIFAPPVTGAPVKKAPTAGTITGVSSIGQGGYPPTNAQGQRICRQCGLPGRYKEGKCVEKWGPGPEGPGTVCDRCRKKMKRVERRGTLDSQHLANAHNGPAAVHPSAAALQHPPMNGRAPPVPVTQVHRTDTLPAHHMAPLSRQLTSQPTHIISGSYRDERQPSSPHPSGPGVPPTRVSQNRSPMTPPEIATLPSASTNDTEGEFSTESERVVPVPVSKKTSRLPTPQPQIVAPEATNGLRPPPSTNGAKSDPAEQPINGLAGAVNGEAVVSKSKSAPMDVDVDADADADADAEADIDADADADADAELLEAVDAAEANKASADESLNDD